MTLKQQPDVSASGTGTLSPHLLSRCLDSVSQLLRNDGWLLTDPEVQRAARLLGDRVQAELGDQADGLDEKGLKRYARAARFVLLCEAFQMMDTEHLERARIELCGLMWMEAGPTLRRTGFLVGVARRALHGYRAKPAGLGRGIDRPPSGPNIVDANDVGGGVWELNRDIDPVLIEEFASDAAVDVFRRFERRPPRMGEEWAFQQYLATTVRRRAVEVLKSYLRGAGPRAAPLDEAWQPRQSFDSASITALHVRDALLRLRSEGILSETDTAIIDLTYFQDRKADTAAVILTEHFGGDWNRQRVYDRRRQVVAKLRRHQEAFDES